MLGGESFPAPPLRRGPTFFPQGLDLKISVVTPTHEKKDLLFRTLDSIAGQDLDPSEFEVVVVNDRSTDDTSSFLAEYLPPYKLRVATLSDNRGRAAARNRGVELATGDLVVFLDDDMETIPGFLRAHREMHEKYGPIIGVGNVRNHPAICVAPIDRYMSTRGAQKIRSQGPLPWKYYSTNNSSVLRQDLVAVGGFDENFTAYGFEDMELALRLVRERGLDIRFVEGAQSLHLHAHSLEDLLKKKTLAGRDSLRYLFQKHPDAKGELGYHRFDPVRSGDPIRLNMARLFYRALLSRPIRGLVRPLADLRLGWFTNLCIDFLVQYEYLRGLREPHPPLRP